MSVTGLSESQSPMRAVLALLVCLGLLLAAEITAWQVQKDFGKVEVSNVVFDNFNGIKIRAKLLRPNGATPDNPMPGVVYIHGYQNNRETGDAYAIELARRGFVVLNIDAIGRGNSGVPGDPSEKDFDVTYGGLSSLEYLRSLPFVKADSVGMMGHSLGAEMAYRVALEHPEVKALVITGFAYTKEATPENPKNMLMIYGKWDEFRQRMTGVRDVIRDWMSTPQTRAAFGLDNPELDKTYGDFAAGTARRVFVPRAIHIQVSHSRAAVAEAVSWMRAALNPQEKLWVPPDDQIWPIKEWATLVAMVAGLALILPLGLLFLKTGFFRSLTGQVPEVYTCPGKSWFKIAFINAVLLWLYLPLILTIFAVHIYVVRIDQAFPMMLLNAIVWWFFWINVIGYILFRIWYKRKAREIGLTNKDMGLAISLPDAGRTVLLAALLFVIIYLIEYVLEAIFIVDWRFIFPFVSDLTAYRARLYFQYLPFFLVGFIQTGIFLHGQLRRPMKKTWWRTYIYWSVTNVLALIVPIILFMMIQYVPLFVNGAIPLVGPGGMFVSMIMNLFHIIGVLILVTPISTWFFQLTGRIYLGAFVNTAVVTWMLVSSQVIAPIPV